MNLKQYIDPFHTISIIGTAKNAGKTTVLNQIIHEYQNKSFALTSIGLDGEKIDNVTNKLKPRIKVYPKTIIATANDCLKECYFKYVIHENTNIRTALGEIIIIEAIEEGLALIAGPSTNSDMIKVIKSLKKYNVEKIFIDGALFRKSIASYNIAEAIILSTGASYNDNMEVVVKDTKLLIDQLSIFTIDEYVKKGLNSLNSSVAINDDLDIKYLEESSLLGNEESLVKYIHPDTKYLYLKGALTDKIIQVFIDNRFKIRDLTLIIKDATKIICSYDMYLKLLKTNIKVRAIDGIKILFVTYNPYSPRGFEFDKTEFRKLLTKHIEVDCINVLEDME